jgi:DNA helicase-2/ATP-dependent DNA helicase PcrA
MIGLEEDILPHKTLGSDVSEERRLFYVGVTRAREKLVLTRARARKRYGQYRPVSPSRFLEEVPRDLVEIYECGFRPVTEDKRQNLMADLFAKLETKAEGQRITK